MYQIAYIGRWETLPETAAAICDHDTSKLEALLQGGLDLDVPIQLSEYIKLMYSLSWMGTSKTSSANTSS